MNAGYNYITVEMTESYQICYLLFAVILTVLDNM